MTGVTQSNGRHGPVPRPVPWSPEWSGWELVGYSGPPASGARCRGELNLRRISVALERTVVLVKPDGMTRGLAGRVMSRFEDRGLILVACKLIQLDDALLREHYAHLVDRPFFPDLSSFMSSSPVLAMCWQGRDAIAMVRNAIGTTDAAKADPGTIRGDLSSSTQFNIVHASEDSENAEREIKRFFEESDLHAPPPQRAQILLAPSEIM